VPVSSSELDPVYAPVDAAPDVRWWDPSVGGLPPIRTSRLGFTDSAPTRVVALAATFRNNEGRDALLSRFGAISQWVGIRYWSTTDQAWRPLFRASAALTDASGPPRGDFTLAEMVGGKPLYFSQTDGRTQRPIISKMRILETTAQSFIVQTENVTAVRWSLLTLFAPGELRSVYFLNQAASGLWRYYSLTGFNGPRWLPADSKKSYINRTVALYRHFTGIRTDLEPPAAP
jgi:hypothetical protein